MKTTEDMFPIEAIATVMTRRLVGDFSDVHRLFEHAFGRPVWTHELAALSVWQQAADILASRCPVALEIEPWDESVPERTDAMRAYLAAYTDRLRARFPRPIEVLAT